MSLNERHEATQETETLRARIAALSAAILRINASLEVDAVLREVVDSARALTGARHGLIAATDGRGEVRDFVVSGVDPERQRAAMEWPDGPRFFEHLRSLAAPLLLPDLDGYVRSLGYSPFPFPYGTFLAMPMRHRDTDVGVFFLGEKEGAFTADDEEVLVLFASQAATALANARAHRAEQRARANLEALVETCPVGVVVFEAASARPLLFNQEARRITAAVKLPGQTVAEMSDILICRFADGREATLGEMRDSEPVRGEEMELCVADGRSVRTLLHLTPVRSAEGQVETVVVTMQDLGPFEALERSRAEFMGMVSHELRAPLAAIKGSAATVLGASREFDMAELRQFFRIVDDHADRMDGLVGELLDAGRIATGTLPVAPEPASVSALVDRARTTFVSGGDRQAVLVDLPPDLPRVMADARAHRAGFEQPAGERLAPFSAGVLDRGGCGARRRACRGLGDRRGRGHDAGASEASVPPARRSRRWGGRRFRPGAGHLQGAGGGARGPHPGGERGTGPGHAGDVHAAGCRRGG